MNLETRIKVEKKVVRNLIRTMKIHNWIVSNVFDGEEDNENLKTEKEIMDLVFNLDDSRIYFKSKNQLNSKGLPCQHWALIVLGNDGYDAIADYGYAANNADNFEAIMTTEIDPYNEKLEEQYA